MSTITQIQKVPGFVMVQMRKPDGGYHRTSIASGADVDKAMGAVNAHLQDMGFSAVSDYSKLKSEVAAAPG